MDPQSRKGPFEVVLRVSALDEARGSLNTTATWWQGTFSTSRISKDWLEDVQQYSKEAVFAGRKTAAFFSSHISPFQPTPSLNIAHV